MRRQLAAMGLAAALAGSVAVSAWVMADDAPTTQPHKMQHASTKPAAIKVDLPWSKIPDLTPEQRAKIHDIHTDALKQEDEIKKKEHADIEALLSDDQKKELLEYEAKLKEERNTHRAHSTTAPAHAATAPANP